MRIRNAEPRDIDAIITLMRDFAEFENLLDHFEITSDDMSTAMFGPGSFVNGLIAEVDGSIVGYAIFYANFATFRGQRGIYLEDLYIAPKYRGKRIGEDMIRRIARSGKAVGVKRIDFQVLEWNKSAIGFYQQLGAVCDNDERHFKFTDDTFMSLAEE
jgi:ribosomal protein S18 acetylase RimI-like enzyme